MFVQLKDNNYNNVEMNEFKLPIGQTYRNDEKKKLMHSIKENKNKLGVTIE